jgi:hypothetical protein
MALLWYSEVHASGNNTYETFVIPDNFIWVNKVANYLGVTEEWVNDFVNQCYAKYPSKRYSFTITFDGLGPDNVGTYSNIRLKNPKFDFNTIDVNIEVLEEAKYCLEHYGDVSQGKEAPYWTKNPPIEVYQAKLMQAAYELFAAMEAAR